jgi:hypothetical protein
MTTHNELTAKHLSFMLSWIQEDINDRLPARVSTNVTSDEVHEAASPIYELWRGIKWEIDTWQENSLFIVELADEPVHGLSSGALYCDTRQQLRRF